METFQARKIHFFEKKTKNLLKNEMVLVTGLNQKKELKQSIKTTYE